MLSDDGPTNAAKQRVTARAAAKAGLTTRTEIHDKNFPMPTLKINGKIMMTNADPDTPLLWVLRADLKMVGTKFGCGKGLCGACTVHSMARQHVPASRRSKTPLDARLLPSRGYGARRRKR
jgi:2Fe-2S iron-sulfur cluster binding domain